VPRPLLDLARRSDRGRDELLQVVVQPVVGDEFPGRPFALAQSRTSPVTSSIVPRPARRCRRTVPWRVPSARSRTRGPASRRSSA